MYTYTAESVRSDVPDTRGRKAVGGCGRKGCGLEVGSANGEPDEFRKGGLHGLHAQNVVAWSTGIRRHKNARRERGTHQPELQGPAS